MVTYVSRSGWTSTDASGNTLTGSKLRGVAVHWPGTSQDEIGTSGIESRLRGYRDYHVGTRGWRDIGYNFAVDQAGRVYMLRSTAWHGNMVGAHCASGANPDANEEYVGVLLLLGDEETPSARMVEAFGDWYHNRFLAHWPGRTDVRGHRQVFGAQTNCPGDRALARIDDMTDQPGGDDMALDRNETFSAVWKNDRMDPPRKHQGGDNEHWQAESVLQGTHHFAESTYEEIRESTPYASPYLGDLREEQGKGRKRSLRHIAEWGEHFAEGARQNGAQAATAAEATRQAVARLDGRIAGLESAIQQLANNVGKPIDMTAVAEAAEAGASAALAQLDATVTLDLAAEDGEEA